MADFYTRSATALDKVLANTSSVKAAAAPYQDSKRVLALLVNTLAYRTALIQAIQAAGILQLERKTFNLNPAPQAPPQKKAKKGKQDNATGTGPLATVPALVLVLAHDLLFSSRGIQAAKTWPAKRALEKHRARLHSELVRLQLRQGKSRIQDLRAGATATEVGQRSHDQIVRAIPRWVRINTLLTTPDAVHAWLARNNFKRLQPASGATAPLGLTASNQYAESPHVANLLAFPPKSTSSLLASELYKKGHLILQDLASCMPAFILNPTQWASTKSAAKLEAIDATSAPGNKTSHLSALMHGKGKLTAFERSQPRYKTLTTLLERAGALATAKSGNVHTVNQDFLQTDPTDKQWARVRFMLVDPSCSGSGIVNRLDYLKQDDQEQDENENDELQQTDDQPRTGTKRKRVANDSNDGPDPDKDDDTKGESTTSKLQQRLSKLADFQLLMLRHAMRFPALERLVYSTCSVHGTENEQVVMRALEQASDDGWTLAPRQEVIPTWPVRGDAALAPSDLADAMIRCVPGGSPRDQTEAGAGAHPHVEASNGFFVACFVRRRTNAS